MRFNFLKITFAVTTLVASSLAQTTADSPVLSDEAIRDILAYRVDTQKQALGIVVGIIEPKGRRVITYGRLDTNDQQPLNGDVVFGVGAITEVFTSLLLADMTQRGEVSLTDPVSKYLPATVKMPERGRKITLQDLATHTSGLPRNPTNLSTKNPANPYENYSAKDLYQFLGGFRMETDVGSSWDYSNLGPGLLGHALALRAHQSYEQLFHTRIAVPLGLKSTSTVTSPAMKAHLAVPHDAKLISVPTWDFQTLAGAGALRSNANDMLTFLAAAMGKSKTTLAPALATIVKVRRPTSWSELENALGWQVCVLDGNEIIRKDGSTLSPGNFGYSTFIGYHPQSGVGVVVLSNAATLMGIDDIGLHLLDARYALRGRDQKEVTVDSKVTDGYLGSYQLSPTAALTVTREGNQLFAKLGAQPKIAIYAESERSYFYKSFDAQLTFETDPQGKASAVILHYNGRHQRAKRVEVAK